MVAIGSPFAYRSNNPVVLNVSVAFAIKVVGAKFAFNVTREYVVAFATHVSSHNGVLSEVVGAGRTLTGVVPYAVRPDEYVLPFEFLTVTSSLAVLVVAAATAVTPYCHAARRSRPPDVPYHAVLAIT